jgi:hypothetical protein
VFVRVDDSECLPRSSQRAYGRSPPWAHALQRPLFP